MWERMPGVLLHHSEAVDPTPVDWIMHQIELMFGEGPRAMVLAIGALILLFAIGLGVLAVRSRRRLEG